MATATEPPPPPPPPPLSLPPLPFTLDLGCPIALPSRPARGFASAWAFPVAGPSTAAEDLGAFVRRRYLETVYLGELLFPISGLLDDLSRAAAAHNDTLDTHIAPLLLTLPQIETRHRRSLLPVIAAAMAVVETSGNIDVQAAAAGLSDAERDVLSSAVDVRMRCRAVAEGERGVPVKALGDEFERREVLVQLVLLLLYRGRNPKPEQKEDKKKKRRSSKPPSVLDDTDTALELLADRIGVWLAVAELGIGEPSTAAAAEDERSVSVTVKRFWDRALVPTFLPREPAFLSTFHLKVFGTPIPPELVPQKKPRKPKVTRRLSIETHPQPAPKMQRVASRPSTTTAASPPRLDSGLRRSASRASDLQSTAGSGFRRSRSTSIDPGARDRTPVVRAPSGKDLFKGRQVGLLRRSSSLLSRNLTKDKDEPRTHTGGLLGRKSAGESLRRHESQSLVESRREAAAETLIYATPAKPKPGKYAAPARGSASMSNLFPHPTPIREEPSSAERSQRSARSYVAETPVAGRTRPAVVAETPVGRRIFETPVRGSAMRHDEYEAHEDDDLGGLMVPTDDEDDNDDDDDIEHEHVGSSTRTLLEPFVPETP